MTIHRKPLAFGVIYMTLSMAIEIALLVVVRLRIPQDNRIIAPVLLIVAPVAAGVLCGYRRPGTLSAVASATVILTLVLVMGFGRLTGISTGVVSPIVLRTLAGWLAAVVTNAAIRS